MSASSQPPTAAIFGCEGLALSDREKSFFARTNPLGFILFARNVRDPGQVRSLVGELRSCVGRADAPVLIDQEGGRVQRLRPPHWRQAPPMARFGELDDLLRASRAARLNASLIAAELGALGIDVDCAPVLDLPVAGAHDVIGDRAFSGDAEVVASLGRAVCDGLLAGGIIPVVKHIPGHGRASVDSHHRLPVVDADLAVLRATDFRPFGELRDAPWAMTAHVVYTTLDAAAPATISKKVIETIIRGEIGFGGVLVSDDLSMKALSGNLDDRARAALAAGCDVVLHCNGDMAEMEAVAAATHPLADAALERLNRATSRRAEVAGAIDVAVTLSELTALIGTAA